MTAPYRTGEPAVYLTDDPDGLRAELAAVLRVRPDGEGWLVETNKGSERVNGAGEGSRLLPLAPEIAAEFEEHGPSFVIGASLGGPEQEPEQAYDWQRYEPEVERGPEQGRGYER